MSGWIKLHRSVQEHWLYTEKRKFSRFEAWNDILLTVNFTDAQTIIKGKVYNVKRGQSILSLDSWAKRWGWEKTSVRRFLNLLQKEEMINLVTDNITTQLTVCKYESYQGDGNANETRMKRKRNTNEIQTTPIEEEEEYKEGKEEEENKAIQLERDFEDFYNAYGKLIDKKASKAVWMKMSDMDRHHALNSVDHYVKANPDKKYRKSPLRWLRNECWKDEYVRMKTEDVKPPQKIRIAV